MQLPDPEFVDVLLMDLGIAPDDPAGLLLHRACRSFRAWEDGDDTAATPNNQSEWQAAEGLLLAWGCWEPVMTWPYVKLDALLGPILPGDVVVMGAATGNGKSTLISNLLDADKSNRFTICPLETKAWKFKVKMACLRLGYDVAAVFQKRWDELGVPESVARTNLTREIRRLAESPDRERIRFVDAPELTVEQVESVMVEAADVGHRLVIVDHLHHMDHGRGPRDEGIRRTMKRTKAKAEELDIAVLYTAQIGRPDKRDLRRRFYPPDLADLQGASAIEQVADIVALLFMPLSPTVKVADLDDVIMGQREFHTVFKSHTMGVKCAKHRLDGARSRGQVAELDFRMGKITDDGPEEPPLAEPEYGPRLVRDDPPPAEQPPEMGDAWEAEAENHH